MNSLAAIFSIDICAYAVMSNHYHVILHVDAKAAETWRPSEVINRWTQLFSTPVLVERYLRGQTTTDAVVNKVCEIVEAWRERLTNISWFMRVLNESIARQANREDHCKGRFWEGRFRSQALLDDAAILACMAETPEESDFTSIQERLRAFANHGRPKNPNPPIRSPSNRPICYPSSAAGAVERQQAFSQRLGRYWLQGIGTSRRLYRVLPVRRMVHGAHCICSASVCTRITPNPRPSPVLSTPVGKRLPAQYPP